MSAPAETRHLGAMFVVWFFGLGALGLHLPYYSLYLRENAGLDGSEVGLVLALMPLVGMLGQPFWGQLADRTGLLGALLKALLVAVPPALLTPAVFFVGVLSSIALDAGYVVLPPVAAALYHAVGRSPLVGLAAVFAGVSAGFSANLVPTSLDALLAGLSQAGAAILDPDHPVAVTANLHFMIASMSFADYCI